MRNRKFIMIAGLCVFGIIFIMAWGLLVREWCQSGRNLTSIEVRIVYAGGADAGNSIRVLAGTPWGDLDEIMQTGNNQWAVKPPRLRYIDKVKLEVENKGVLRAIQQVQYRYEDGKKEWVNAEIGKVGKRDSTNAAKVRAEVKLPPLNKTVLPPYRGTLNWRGDLNLLGRSFSAVFLALATIVTPVIILMLVIQNCVNTVRFSERKQSRRYVSLCLLIISSVVFVMVLNTFTHPPANSYDAGRQEAAVRTNESLYHFSPTPLAYQFEYHPVLYYYVLGKANHFGEVLLGRDINPYYLMRVVHIILLLTILLAYAFIFSPRMLRNEVSGIVLVASMAVIPNLFVAQVMVRPGHLLLFTVHLMFICWFAFDFRNRLGRDRGITLLWAVLLITMANSQALAFPAFALFGAWGGWILVRDYWRSRSSLKLAATTSLCGIIVLLGGQHYLLRYARTGHITDINHELPYFQRHYERQKGFDRLPLFLNVEFQKLLETPNRYASFTGGNAFLPRLYGDMWGDHWLYFSSKVAREEGDSVSKKTVFILAIPFTALFFLAPILCLFRRPVLNIEMQEKVASFLFMASFLLMIFLVYKVPEPGKNSLVKFCYMMGYYGFPAVCMGSLFDKHRKTAKVLCWYILLLGIACIPLYIFII